MKYSIYDAHGFVKTVDGKAGLQKVYYEQYHLCGGHCPKMPTCTVSYLEAALAGFGLTVRRNEWHETVDGIDCTVRNERFPDGVCVPAYTFTVPGWDECTVCGLNAAKRVIHGRLDHATRNTLGIKW